MNRVYQSVLEAHFSQHRQMAFVSGPRQVGKTTLLKTLAPTAYVNWDDPAGNLIFLKGANALAAHCGLDTLCDKPPLLAFDEIHKCPQWKSTLKGFFDKYGERVRIAVTGSARFDLYKRGGDSMRGRYLSYRAHPLSLGELVGGPLAGDLLRPPVSAPVETLKDLAVLGGFPEPLLKGSLRFYKQWARLQHDQILRDEVRDMTAVREISQLNLLGVFLSEQAGGAVNYSSLGKFLRASSDSIRRWCDILENLYFCYFVRPYSRNIRRSLIKEPKVYLWDWSGAPEGGHRWKNLVAGHLLKAAHYWTDLGLGVFDLHFLRDKEQREVDFLVTQDGKPWFLVEVKTSKDAPLNPALDYFQKETGAKHAWQAAVETPATGADCFSVETPVKISLADLLARLP